MTLALVLAVAYVQSIGAEPRPKPIDWKARVSLTKDIALDNFAIKVIDAVRSNDWERTAALCGKRVIFSAYEKVKLESASRLMLFDDAVSTEETPLAQYEVRSIEINTKQPLTYFAQNQFTYFASLVDSSVQDVRRLPAWGSRIAESTNQISRVTVKGRYATNAVWWIEVDQDAGPWRIRRFVIETQ